MALVINDRVKETSTTSGTGTLNLAGAVTGFDTFVSGIGDTNTTYYAIFEQGTANWEVGLGTVGDATPDTLARTTVISNSLGNTDKISFGGETADVFCTMPATKTLYLDDSGVATAAAGIGTSANNLVQLNGSAQLPAVDGSLLTGIGRSWQAVKTSSFLSVAGEGYFVDTLTGTAAVTATLPTSASIGDTIAFIDYASSFATYKLEIARAGHNIQGVASNLDVETDDAGFQLVYVDSTKGWLIQTK